MDYILNPSATPYLSETIVRREVVLRMHVRHMWFRTEGKPPPLYEDNSVFENADFLLINTD